MAWGNTNLYEFAGFSLDAEHLVLYHKAEIVKNVDKRSLEVLRVLVLAGGSVASHDEVIEAVWGDNAHGVTPARINQYVSHLRKLFAEYDDKTLFIENLKGSGYRMAVEVESVPAPHVDVIAESGSMSDAPAANNSELPHRSGLRTSYTVIVAMIAVVLLAGAVMWTLYPQDHIAEVKRVITESQRFESLVLYKNPEQFQETDLDEYWSPELGLHANYDRTRIRASIRKLVAEGRRYGDETRCEQFDFQSVNVNQKREQATARTLEQWFLAHYDKNGILLRVNTVGPYFVDYLLRNTDGRWLIERSTTARTIRPTPRLSEVVLLTAPEPNKEFLVNLVGGDLESFTIHLEITGNGCPEAKPCRLDNSELLERAVLTDNSLDNVPLTLPSGEFRIVARNGDSKPSGSVIVVVP